MLPGFVAVIVLFAVWLQWRAVSTAEVRALLAELADGVPAAEAATQPPEVRLGDLIDDLRDKRLAFRCQAVLADHRAGDAELFREHVADALDRIEHLERFAPRRLLPARPS